MVRIWAITCALEEVEDSLNRNGHEPTAGDDRGSRSGRAATLSRSHVDRVRARRGPRPVVRRVGNRGEHRQRRAEPIRCRARTRRRSSELSVGATWRASSFGGAEAQGRAANAEGANSNPSTPRQSENQAPAFDSTSATFSVAENSAAGHRQWARWPPPTPMATRCSIRCRARARSRSACRQRRDQRGESGAALDSRGDATATR